MRFFLFGLMHLWVLSFITAQECVPAPGPAIFFEDFGSGSTAGLALPGGTTTYSYGSIETGGYVVSNISGINGSFWHSGIDHTEGDTDGYMLIFNSFGGPTILYQRTFTGLCPNTNYIFSVYAANAVVPTACIGIAEQPNVKLEVINPSDGSTQASSASGEIFYSSFLDWREYTVRFHTGPDQTNALFELSNLGRCCCGNDLAVDDISLSLCNVQREQEFDLCDLPGGRISVGANTYTEAGIYFDAIPIPNSCNDTLITTTLTGITRVFPTLRYTFCEGETLELAGQSFSTSTSFVDTLPGPLPECQQYQPYEIVAQSVQTFSQEVGLCLGDSLRVGNNWYSNAGVYADTLFTASGCDSIVTTTITTGDILVSISPTTVELDFGQSIQMTSVVSRSNSYTLSWQPEQDFSCTDCPDPLLRPQASGTYQLIVTDIPSGCTVEASVQVQVQSCEKVFVPNAFSPNRDGLNDQLEVFTEPCFTRLIAWRIFNRWGGLVYEITDQPLANSSFLGWDGRVNGQFVAQGIYGYQLVLERVDGTQKGIRGEVLLLY